MARVIGSTQQFHRPLRVVWRDWDDDSLLIVIACVHPENLGDLPPSPHVLAYKAEQIGLVSSDKELTVARGYNAKTGVSW